MIYRFYYLKKCLFIALIFIVQLIFSGCNERGKTALSKEQRVFYVYATEQIELRDYKPSTKESYHSIVNKMKEFAPDLHFGDINHKWLQLFSQYMRVKKENTSNTIWKCNKFVYLILNFAVKDKTIPENPMKDFDRGRYWQSIPQYLEWAESELIADTVRNKPLNGFMKLVGHYALLSYYSGLRFSDSIAFRYDTKVVEDQGGKRLLLHAAKNGEMVSIAFTSHIAWVVEFIKDKPLSVSVTEFNKALGTLGKIAGVKKTLTSHDMRHGFGMRCAELRISIETTQRLMGHRDRKSTEIYYRVKNARQDDEMKAWEQ